MIALEILSVLQNLNLQILPIEAPHFRYTKRRKERRLVGARIRNIDFNNKIGWGIYRKVEIVFLAHSCFVFEVKAAIGLKTALEIGTLESSGAKPATLYPK